MVMYTQNLMSLSKQQYIHYRNKLDYLIIETIALCHVSLTVVSKHTSVYKFVFLILLGNSCMHIMYTYSTCM